MGMNQAAAASRANAMNAGMASSQASMMGAQSNQVTPKDNHLHNSVREYFLA